NMNGLEFLDKIMRLRPMPVLMVSTLTQRGAEATIAALEIGAFDCVGKPRPGDPHPFGDLADEVKAAARSQRKAMNTSNRTAAPAVATASDYRAGRKIIAIGASTGVVEALITVLQKFPANCPPTVITQHMPHTFTKSFADRLNRLCAPTVQQAPDGARLDIGRGYLAPGGGMLAFLTGSKLGYKV
ncbi:response regulator, partial [Pseudomonas syringae]